VALKDYPSLLTGSPSTGAAAWRKNKMASYRSGTAVSGQHYSVTDSDGRVSNYDPEGNLLSSRGPFSGVGRQLSGGASAPSPEYFEHLKTKEIHKISQAMQSQRMKEQLAGAPERQLDKLSGYTKNLRTALENIGKQKDRILEHKDFNSAGKSMLPELYKKMEDQLAVLNEQEEAITPIYDRLTIQEMELAGNAFGVDLTGDPNNATPQGPRVPPGRGSVIRNVGGVLTNIPQGQGGVAMPQGQGGVVMPPPGANLGTTGQPLPPGPIPAPSGPALPTPPRQGFAGSVNRRGKLARTSAIIKQELDVLYDQGKRDSPEARALLQEMINVRKEEAQNAL